MAQQPTTDTHGGHAAGEPHVLPLSIYWGVFLALVVGTVATVWTATMILRNQAFMNGPAWFG